MVEGLGLVASDLLELVLPSSCPGCGASSDRVRSPWCTPCAPIVKHRLVVPSPPPAGFPITVRTGEYTDLLRVGILAHKDGTRRDLGADHARALASAIRWVGWERNAVLVPVPSVSRARRRRGFDHTLDLARRASSHLSGSRVIRAVRANANAADHGGMTAAQRQSAPSALRPARSGTRAFQRIPPDSHVILVDDIATTGWTLTRAAAALRVVGVEVTGAVVVASTLLRSSASVDSSGENFPPGAQRG